MMSLDALCREIAATAEARAARLMREAQASAKTVLEEAKEAAANAVAAAKAEGHTFAKAETAERLNAGQLESSKTLSEAREEAVRQAVEQVWAHYRLMPKRPGYAKKLRQWAERAQSELGLADALLRANASDLPLLAEAGFRVNRAPIECAGGVRAESKDGRIIVDYTLESQFDSKREEVGRECFARLFADSDDAAMMTGEGGAKKARTKSSPASRARAPSSRPPKGRAQKPKWASAKRGRR